MTGAVGLYMAWNIGANDVANAMGTSVGSGALSLRRAILVAGLLEFLGAVLVGAYVTDTVRKGIVDPAIFANSPRELVFGMMAALLAAALWLNAASVFGFPVSTTHAIVGAVAGFGLLFGGTGAINWGKLGFIVASWFVSPVIGGLVAYLVYMALRKSIIERRAPGEHAHRQFPAIVGLLLFVLALVFLFKGLKNLHLDLSWYHVLGGAALLGLLGAGTARLFRRERKTNMESTLQALQGVEATFKPLQVATACAVAFAHGANDVANAVGPMAAVFSTIRSGEVLQKVDVPIWILLLGGGGIVLGLATYGYRVMATIGTRITEMTPSRGFAAELGAAITILFGSKLGLPLSTTHTLVGAVIGVGFARGMGALDLRIIRNIVASWLLTVPIAAGVALPIYYLLRFLAGS
ncbi:MAG: inorganic phosphate transporter [Deltaproteobacteria bacterium]|nr:inorganic phosphate transporter [Deltaproteobacteria bacterium]